MTRFRRDHVGFVFQFYNLVPSLTARENVALITGSRDPMTPARRWSSPACRRAATISRAAFRRRAAARRHRAPPSPNGPRSCSATRPTGALG